MWFRVTSLFLMLLLTLFINVGCSQERNFPEAYGSGTVQSGQRVAGLDDLNIPRERLNNQGEIEQIWWLNEQLILLKQVWNQDYDFYLYNTATRDMTWIVPFIENARLDKIAKDKLVFLAKGGGDCGSYEFPYQLTYDLSKKELVRNNIYLQRDVVFGFSHTFEYILDNVEIKNNEVFLHFNLAEGQVPAGGFRYPFTVADCEDKKLSVRIYRVASVPSSKLSKGKSSVVEGLSFKTLSEETPVGNIPLLKEQFPYGAGLAGEISYRAPSVLFEFQLNEKSSYNISYIHDPGNDSMVCKINFQPASGGYHYNKNLSELTEEKLKGLNPAQVMDLYLQANQQRDIGSLRVLLAEGTGLAGVEETVTERKLEWEKGYWMVIDYSVGDYTIKDNRANVVVNMKTTNRNGKIVEHVNIPYHLSRQNGAWKVDILAAQ